jgi:uncharacterized membrane protein YvlD (DUF360 family)
MIVRLAIRLVVLAVIIGVVTRIVPGIHLHGGFVWLPWIALIFSIVNLLPVFHRGKHAHPARAVHDSA